MNAMGKQEGLQLNKRNTFSKTEVKNVGLEIGLKFDKTGGGKIFVFF